MKFFLGWLAVMLLLFGSVVDVINAQGLKNAINDLLIEPKWYLTTEVRMRKNTLIRIGDIANSFYADPLVPIFKTTLRLGDPTKLSFEATHELIHYTESQTSYRSQGNERFLLRASYGIKPGCLNVNMEWGWDSYRYGPGISYYDPFLTVGTESGGFTEENIDNTERLGAGINITWPSMTKKIVSMRVSVGGQQKSRIYPSSETISESSIRYANLVDKMSVYGNIVGDLVLSPKFKISWRGNIEPDNRIGYYTTGGYAEIYYTSKTLEIGSEYRLNPALKVSFGYYHQEKESGRTIGKGAEEFGLPAEKRKTGTDEFIIKFDFHP